VCTDGERDQCALLNLRQRRRGKLHAEIGSPGNDVGHGFGRALERDVLRLEGSARAQPFGAEVRRRADAGRGIIQRAGLGLGGGDQIAERLVALGGEDTITSGCCPSEITGTKSFSVS